MTIGMQGSWTVSIASQSATWPQRFRIQGSSNGVDGTYDSANPTVFVSGAQWGVTVEHNPTGPISWRSSRNRLANYRISGGQFLFDIQTDDSGGGDADFNDLILTCAMPLADSEYVVYGSVKTYSGPCYFNPCYPLLYYVIDYPWQLKELLKYPPARRIIEKVYPERVKEFERIPPFPLPDPPPFKPMMLPSGLREVPGLNVLPGMKAIQMPEVKRQSKKAAAAAEERAQDAVLSLAANVTVDNTLLAQEEMLTLARLGDRLKLKPCTVTPVTETIMRFLEYDRTAAEKLGDPYSGEGDRQLLGTSATDEFGNYLFRFSQDLTQLVAETTDVAVGEDLATEIRPDLIIQLVESLPNDILYETAPYYNIPNVKQINLCLPSSALPGPATACQGGRAIQALGNLSIVTSGTTLHGDGTVSNTNSTGPIVSHAAWYATVDLFACFLDTTPDVKHYVIRYRNQGETDWNFVTEQYKHPRKQGDGTWQNETIGPLPVSLRVNGAANPKVTVGAYLNIEDQINNSDWLNWHRDRKLQINTSVYQATAGAVEFRIEGFDASGEIVPGALDTVKLYIDNTRSQGDIDYVKLGAVDPGECAFFELPTAGEPLTVRYRATDAEGFMSSYALNVYRGSNTHVPTENPLTGNPVTASYQPVAPYRFSGTLDETLDPTGYVEISLEPSAGSWLPAGVDFCAFSFELTASDRKTNGYGVFGGRTLWRELIGISYTPPPTP